MKSAMKRHLHLPLPEELYEALRAQAKRRGLPATAVARDAIEEWLHEAKKMAIAEGIAAYASAHADSPADLDQALEEVGLETLRKLKD